MRDGAAARAPHLTPGLVALVGLGGAIGTGAREALSLAAPEPAADRLVILGINVAGAFVLGVLLEALLRHGPDVGGARRLRLFVGTGVCGGFTTYSTLAVGTAGLLRSGDVAGGLWYAAATLIVGAAATVAGVATGAALARRRSP